LQRTGGGELFAGVEARSSRSDDASAEFERADVPRAATRSGASTA